jgi:hypothetical protein
LSLVDAGAHGDLVGSRLTPDVRPPHCDVDDVLDTMNHLPGCQQLAVVVAAIDASDDAAADVQPFLGSRSTRPAGQGSAVVASTSAT